MYLKRRSDIWRVLKLHACERTSFWKCKNYPKADIKISRSCTTLSYFLIFPEILWTGLWILSSLLLDADKLMHTLQQNSPIFSKHFAKINLKLITFPLWSFLTNLLISDVPFLGFVQIVQSQKINVKIKH